MVNLTYYLARSVEAVSWTMGAGSFEVNTHYLCHNCASSPESQICEDCKDVYLDELSVLEYSDAFERHVIAAIGSDSVVLGVVAALANVGECFWAEGDLVSWLTAPWTSLISPSTPFYSLTILLLTTIWLLSLLCVVSNTLVACFLLALNPLSRRHYRNMNWGVYVVFVLLGFAVGCVYVWGGMGVVEGVFVGAPVAFGGVALGCAACVGMGMDGKEGEGGEGGVRLGMELEEGKVGDV